MGIHTWARFLGNRLLLLALAMHSANAADSDQDGIPDSTDACPVVVYAPAFDWRDCAPMDLDPGNDPQPECRTRERVAQMLLSSSASHVAFAIVQNRAVHFGDAFTHVGDGQYEHDPDGIHRLYRVGSTTKSVVAAAAKILDEHGELSLEDFVSDDDGSQELVNGQRTLRHLLTHQGAFLLDSGALHLFCYPTDLAAFWAEPDDLISPHYDTEPYGNLGGGFAYSAFNYSLAGAYLANRTGEPFGSLIQTRVFDSAEMCTATLDGFRATNTPIGTGVGFSTAAVMHVGPYINLVSPTDKLCEDNFYSSEDLPGDEYTHQLYHLDEASALARDPAGGVIASVVDMAHFAEILLASYHGPDGLLSQEGVRDLWAATSDLGCYPNCPYERYYGVGFFTDTQPGEPVMQVGHGGSRAGYTSAFVLRPEANLAVSVLADGDLSTVAMSDLAKVILDDLESAASVESDGGVAVLTTHMAPIAPNPLAGSGRAAMVRFTVPEEAWVQLEAFDVGGRLVNTLANERYSAGEHEVRWSPADHDLAPGVYFIRLASLGTVKVRTVVFSE